MREIKFRAWDKVCNCFVTEPWKLYLPFDPADMKTIIVVSNIWENPELRIDHD